MPLRVYMYPAGVAGMAFYSYKLANALAERGLRVTQFVEDQYELENLPIKFTKARVLSGKYTGVNSNQGKIRRIVKIIGAYCYNSRKFYYYVKRDSPEVVHLQSFLFYPIEWYLVNRLRMTDSRIVLTVHNVLPYKFYTLRFTKLELMILRYIYNVADKLIVHSENNKQQLLKNFSLESDKVVVIPHGEYSIEKECREVSESEARSRLGVKKKERIILFFGYIRKIKGLDVLLEAFDQVAERFQDIVLIIAGSVIEGQSFDQYRQIMDRMRHGYKVRCFLEYVQFDKIPTFFRPADIVVLPYIEFSAQSGVLHLAQGFGKPVIVTNVGGLPEAVDDHETGLIVPPGDVTRLADALAYLLGNDRLRTTMGQQAQKRATEKFSWNAIAKITIEKAYT